MTRKYTRREALEKLGQAAGALTVAPAIGLTACSQRRLDADVIVVGAGLSGLQAAIILQDAGMSVLVLEGSGRSGGRVFTLDGIPGHPEAGGSEIGSDYARVLDMLNRVGAPEMVKWLEQVDPRMALNVDGSTLSMADWPNAEVNRLDTTERQIPPIALAARFLPKESPLPDLASWLEPEARQYDVPFGEYLRQQGASEEALRLLSVQVPSDTLDGTSALWKLRTNRVEKNGGGVNGLRRIKSGTSRLPEGMVGLLKREIRFNTHVVSIRSDDKAVAVTDKAGNIFHAAYAVCSVPLTMTREIHFEPELPAIQAEAYRSIPQGHATSVFFHVVEPYWEEDGLPAGFWSNTATGWVLRYQYDAGYYLWFFKDGRNNLPWRTMDDADILQEATAELHTARPSTVGRVEPTGVFNWSRYPWLMGGNAFRAPGNVAKYGNVIAQAHGRIHFAGVHTAVMMMGMEGAMESGERAGIEILQRV